jgi:hypothetical protein
MPLFPWTYWGQVGTVSKGPNVEAHCPWGLPWFVASNDLVTIWLFTRRHIGAPQSFTESLQKACLCATAPRSPKS